MTHAQISHTGVIAQLKPTPTTGATWLFNFAHNYWKSVHATLHADVWVHTHTHTHTHTQPYRMIRWQTTWYQKTTRQKSTRIRGEKVSVKLLICCTSRLTLIVTPGRKKATEATTQNMWHICSAYYKCTVLVCVHSGTQTHTQLHN